MRIDGYEAMVDKLAKENSQEFIDNSSMEHAAILIQKMIENAKKSIDIFSGAFNKNIYERVALINAAKKFISNGGKLMVIVQNNNFDPRSHKFFNAMIQDCASQVANEQIKLFSLPEKMSEKLNAHFLIKDNIGFRYEANKEKHEAIACFNDLEVAQSLINLFDALIERATARSLV